MGFAACSWKPAFAARSRSSARAYGERGDLPQRNGRLGAQTPQEGAAVLDGHPDIRHPR
jgi:hypothetical protein